MPSIKDAAELDMVRRYANGEDIAAIAGFDDKAREQVGKLISRVCGYNRQKARAAVLAFDQEHKAAPAHSAASADQPPGAGDPDDGAAIVYLLRRAEKAGVPKIAAKAAEIRRQLQQLTMLLDQHETEEQLREEIRRLTAQRELKQQELKVLAGRAGAAAKASATAATAASVDEASADEKRRVRAWAKQNGKAVAAVGKVSRALIAEYREEMNRGRG